MAFITNQKGEGSKKLGERLGELMGHANRLDMLVGFFFFSGVKVLYDALKARAGMKMRGLARHQGRKGHLRKEVKEVGRRCPRASV